MRKVVIAAALVSLTAIPALAGNSLAVTAGTGNSVISRPAHQGQVSIPSKPTTQNRPSLPSAPSKPPR